jgi:beta-lactamase class A
MCPPCRRTISCKDAAMKYLTALVAGLLVTPLFLAKAENENDASEKFAALEKRASGRIGVAAFDASRNKRIEYHADQRFLMCSTFKALAVAAILKRVDENKDQLDRFVRYDEKQLLEHAPVTREHVKEGGMTLDALCAGAITQSDNTAANLLLDSIGGPKGVTELARTLGDNSTRLDRMEPELNTGKDGDDRDTTTPAAMGRDLERLLTSDFLTQASRTRLEGWMQANQTGATLIRASVPKDWKVGDKTGRSSNGATNDVAILRPPSGGPVFLSIYTIVPAVSSEERDKLVAEVAKAALDALNK